MNSTQEWPPDLVAGGVSDEKDNLTRQIQKHSRHLGHSRQRASATLSDSTGIPIAYEQDGDTKEVTISRKSAQRLADENPIDAVAMVSEVADKLSTKHHHKSFGGGNCSRTLDTTQYHGLPPNDPGHYDFDFNNHRVPSAVPISNLSYSSRELLKAVTVGSLNDIYELLGRCMDLNEALDTDGKTALHYVALRGKCCQPEPPSSKGPGGEAIIHNEELKEPTEADASTPCPRCHAIMPFPEVVIRVLLEHGCSPKVRTKESGWTPLHLACVLGHSDNVKDLLRWEPDAANLKDSLGRTPAHVQGGRDGLILSFLRHVGADLYAKDNRLQTPLHAAVFAGLNSAVNFLQLDVHKPRKRRQKRKCPNQKPKDPFGLLDIDGNAPIHVAVAENHFTIVKYLVISDDNCLDRVDSNGRTPLQLAEDMYRNQGQNKILAYLQNAELERTEIPELDHEKYPLHCFALQGNLDELRATMGTRMQMGYGTRDDKGYTPLHYAAWAGHTKCVKWLQNRQGVVSDAVTDIFENALEIAGRNRHNETVDFLESGIVEESEDEESESEEESEDEHVDPELDFMSDECTVQKPGESNEEFLSRLRTLLSLMEPPLENAEDAMKLVGGVAPEDPIAVSWKRDIEERVKTIDEIHTLQTTLDLRLSSMRARYEIVKKKERKMRLQVYEMLDKTKKN